jgi:hypothetical protein
VSTNDCPIINPRPLSDSYLFVFCSAFTLKIGLQGFCHQTEYAAFGLGSKTYSGLPYQSAPLPRPRGSCDAQKVCLILFARRNPLAFGGKQTGRSLHAEYHRQRLHSPGVGG